MLLLHSFFIGCGIAGYLSIIKFMFDVSAPTELIVMSIGSFVTLIAAILELAIEVDLQKKKNRKLKKENRKLKD